MIVEPDRDKNTTKNGKNAMDCAVANDKAANAEDKSMTMNLLIEWGIFGGLFEARGHFASCD